MRFLCMHGKGTNSKIFEMQTAAIRYGLGPEHSYEFIDGAFPEDMAPGFDTTDPSGMKGLNYILDPSLDDGASIIKARQDLSDVLDHYGPFDGIMAFSYAASLLASYLIWTHRQTDTYPVRLAVFFSGGKVGDPNNHHRFMDATEDRELIDLPTAHVWGVHDELCPPESTSPRGFCVRAMRSEFEFDGGHEIPGARNAGAVTKAILTIKRAIAWAEDSIDETSRVTLPPRA